MRRRAYSSVWLATVMAAMAWVAAPGAMAMDDTAPPESTRPDRGTARPPINSLMELFSAIERCWVPPPLNLARPGMEITVLVNFKRNGEILGRPKITYETPGASDEERIAYRKAVLAALERCSPLPFTDAFGGATAGAPKTIRFIDSRTQKKAERTT